MNERMKTMIQTNVAAHPIVHISFVANFTDSRIKRTVAKTIDHMIAELIIILSVLIRF